MIEVGAVPGYMSELPAEPKAGAAGRTTELQMQRRRSSAT